MAVSVKQENMVPAEKKLKVVFADPPFGLNLKVKPSQSHRT